MKPIIRNRPVPMSLPEEKDNATASWKEKAQEATEEEIIVPEEEEVILDDSDDGSN